MHMESNMNKWNIGQKVSLPWETKLLKKDKKNSYERMIGSYYICIREASDRHNGILLRVLDDAKASSVMLVCGQPFFQDESTELFEGGCSYSSYSSPTVVELKESLAILRSNPSLFARFEEASMSINLQSLFWVNETARNNFFMKKPLCYNPSTDSLCIASDSVAPCRLTMVYFNTQLQIVDFVKDPSDATTTEAVIQQTSGMAWKKWVLPAVLGSAAIFYGGYLTGRYSVDQKDIHPVSVDKPLVKENVHKATTPVKKNVPEAQTPDKEIVPETQTPVKEDVVPSQQNEPAEFDQYEAKDIRVRVGAYRIVGTDHFLTVRNGDDMTSIARRTLGPGMECYIEVYNDIESGTPLEEGQTIRIPKVRLK